MVPVRCTPVVRSRLGVSTVAGAERQEPESRPDRSVKSIQGWLGIDIEDRKTGIDPQEQTCIGRCHLCKVWLLAAA
eukprot:15452383-Alexandrium_andersonii.AAC.1